MVSHPYVDIARQHVVFADAMRDRAAADFHHEFDELFEEEISAPPMAANTPRASLDRVVEAAQKLYPGQFILFMQPSQTEPVVSVATSPTAVPLPGMFRRTTFDARTVEVLGDEVPHLDVMNIILRIHRDMFVGLPGGLFLGVIGLVFVVSLSCRALSFTGRS
jgi:uncharacterized iron-regulated membrane protein